MNTAMNCLAHINCSAQTQCTVG